MYFMCGSLSMNKQLNLNLNLISPFNTNKPCPVSTSANKIVNGKICVIYKNSSNSYNK